MSERKADSNQDYEDGDPQKSIEVLPDRRNIHCDSVEHEADHDSLDDANHDYSYLQHSLSEHAAHDTCEEANNQCENQPCVARSQAKDHTSIHNQVQNQQPSSSTCNVRKQSSAEECDESTHEYENNTQQYRTLTGNLVPLDYVFNTGCVRCI